MNPALRAATIAEWRGLPQKSPPRDRWQCAGDLVPKLMQRLGLRERLHETEVIEAWSKIVGEFIASERGLGYLMIQVQSSLDTPAMVMAVVLLTLLGVALYGLVLGLERLFVVKDVRLQ